MRIGEAGAALLCVVGLLTSCAAATVDVKTAAGEGGFSLLQASGHSQPALSTPAPRMEIQAVRVLVPADSTNGGLVLPVPRARGADADAALLEARVAQQVRYWSEQRQLDPLLVWAIIEAESGGSPHAVSAAGAQGLMQVMPEHFVVGEDPFDVATNIERGTRVLAAYLTEMGSLRLGVAAYNAGPGAVRKHGDVPPYEETQRFVRNVLDRYQALLAQAKVAGGVVGGSGAVATGPGAPAGRAVIPSQEIPLPR